MAKKGTGTKTKKPVNKPAPAQQSAAVNVVRHGHHYGIFAIGGIVVILLAAGFFLYGNSMDANMHEHITFFPNLNSTPPQQFSSLPTFSGTQTSAALANLSSSQLHNMSEFAISYSGQVYAKGSGIESVVSFLSPLNVSYLKYESNESFDINATSASAFGDVNINYLNITNGTYTCTNFNSSAASSGNADKLLFGSRSEDCVNGNQIAGVNLARLAQFNFSQAAQYGIIMHYSALYQSQYDGMPCTYLYGNLSEVNSSAGNIGNGEFGMCISDAYYVPLSLSAYISGVHGVFSVSINETNITNYTSAAQVEKLP